MRWTLSELLQTRDINNRMQAMLEVFSGQIKLSSIAMAVEFKDCKGAYETFLEIR